MPKVVDHEERRQTIVAALWRVVQRDGTAGTSVRSVAAEAGVSPGALRHYFTTHGELLRFAIESLDAEVGRRVALRTSTWDEAPPDVEAVAKVLEEVTPLDARRRAEFEVWLEMVLLARTTPDLRELAVAAHRGLRQLCLGLVLIARGLDPDTAANRRDPAVRRATDALHATLDGISLHLALYPGETSRARAAAVLHDALAAASAG